MATNETLSEYVAGEIRATLARQRTSGRELAAMLGVSRSWISYRLTGTTEISIDDLARIASALDVEVWDLLPPRRESQAVTYAAPERRVKPARRPNDRSLRPTGSVPVASDRPGGVARTDKRQLVESRYGPKIGTPTVRRPSRITSHVADSVVAA